jgi:hypothetical protein
MTPAVQAAALDALHKAATILQVDRDRAVRQGRDDTVGASVLALVRSTIAQAEQGKAADALAERKPAPHTFTVKVAFTRDDGREAERVWTRFGSMTQACEDGAAYARTEIAVGSTIRRVTIIREEG